MMMKVGLLSAFVIYLVINIILNFTVGYLVINKKIKNDSPIVHAISAVQGLVMLVFTILLIRKVVKSGLKA